jgi:uncharacterized protein YihD (DUF1040 family)
MRDPDRIPRILSELQLIWQDRPDLRLGQLLMNVFSEAEEDLYYMEDDEIIRAIERYYRRFQKQPWKPVWPGQAWAEWYEKFSVEYRRLTGRTPTIPAYVLAKWFADEEHPKDAAETMARLHPPKP